MARTVDESIYLILNLAKALAQASDLDELYEAIGFGAELAYQLYPHIDCHTGCNRCCRNNSLPIVSPLEWATLYEGVLAMSDAEKQNLAARAVAWQGRLGEELWTLHDLLQAPPGPGKFEGIATVLEAFQETACPLLVDERCGAYTVRPAKCRAHGAYLLRIGTEVQMHTCAEEVAKMEGHLAKQGSRKVALPFWNPAEERLAQLNGPGAVSTVLPLWVIAHVADGTMVPDVALCPDWAEIQRQWRGRR